MACPKRFFRASGERSSVSRLRNEQGPGQFFENVQMRRVVSTFVAAICIALAAGAAQTAQAQIPVGGVAVGFRNELNRPVIVQGYTKVNGMPKRGMAMVVLPGKVVVDNNVPGGATRYYMICDANQPNLVYIRDFPIQIGANDVNILIRGVAPKVFLEPAP
jgi:hypothetical protein